MQLLESEKCVAVKADYFEGQRDSLLLMSYACFHRTHSGTQLFDLTQLSHVPSVCLSVWASMKDNEGGNGQVCSCYEPLSCWILVTIHVLR
jgi:hypothetical protein